MGTATTMLRNLDAIIPIATLRQEARQKAAPPSSATEIHVEKVGGFYFELVIDNRLIVTDNSIR